MEKCISEGLSQEIPFAIRLKFEDQLSLFPQKKALKAKLVEWKITEFHQVFGRVYDRIGFANQRLLTYKND